MKSGSGVFGLIRRLPRGRAVANASVVSAVTLGVVGVMLGSGVASTALGVSDGVTWLADPATGEVLQYNPSTRRVERTVRAGAAGDPLEVSQATGGVAVRNARTGEVVTVDISASGVGRRSGNDKSKVVMAKGLVVVIDSGRGVVTRVDPVKGGDIGTPYRVNGALVTGVADEEGTIWVATTAGELIGLRWDDSSAGLVQTVLRRLTHSVTPGSVLSPHNRGATLFDSRAGLLAQVGTGRDVEEQDNRLIGADATTVLGPSDLVPATLPDQSSVVLLDGGVLKQFPTVGMGCDRPIDPVAFNDVVYVVCQGSSKVIRLTRKGAQAGPDITTPGDKDAEPVADEGRLMLNVSGAEEGIEVDRGGNETRFDRRSRGVPGLDVSPGDGAGAASGRESAQQDLQGEPVRGSGSGGNVNTSLDQFGSRTEVVTGGRGRETSTGVGVDVPGADEVKSDNDRGRGRGHGPQPTPEATPDEGNSGNDQSDNGRSERGRESYEPKSRPSPDPGQEPPGDSGDSGDSGSENDPGRERTPTARATGPSGPTDGSPVPTPSGTNGSRTPGGTGTPRPSSSGTSTSPRPSTPAPTTTTARPTSAPSTPRTTTTRSVTLKPSVTPSTSRSATPRPTNPTTTATRSQTPKPQGSVTAVSASAKADGSVRVNWSGTGTSFTVTVGSTSRNFVGSQRTATLTGFSQGTHQVTVKSGSSSKQTTVTVPAKTTPKPTAPPKTTRPPATKPPANPTGVRGTHTGTSATVSWNKVAGATSYTYYCNDVGEQTTSSTSGSVSCGASSAGKKVRVGVRANNAAGKSSVVEVWAS